MIAAPFAHKILDATFDAETYAALDACFPTPEQMRAKVLGRRNANYSDKRFTIPLADHVRDAPPQEQDLWRRVSSILYGSGFARALFTAFAPVFLKDLEANYGTRKFRYDVVSELVYDRTGFALKPHTDASAKAATMLTYVAAPGDPETLGTVLFEPVDPDLADTAGTRLWEADGFRAVSRVPFRPNLSVAFARHGRSFHGVAETTSPRPRRLIQTSLIVAAKVEA